MMELILELARVITFWSSVIILAFAFCCGIAAVELWLSGRGHG